MLTCFLFVQNLDQEIILSMSLDLQGQVVQPLQMRSLEDIRTLQQNARTIIVFPTDWCGIYTVELPLLSEHKAREAIPFALEDQLAQPVSQLHFVFDKAYYQKKHYLVVVIEKQLMRDWMHRLSALDLAYDMITIDWFALSQEEGCVLEHSVIVNTESFSGSLSLDIWASHAHAWSTDLRWHVFANSANVENLPVVSPSSKVHHTWVSERLLNTKLMNLCQGDFQHATSQTQVKRLYQLTGVMAGVCFLGFVTIHVGLSMWVTHKTRLLDQQIATSYRVFFPQAQQVISPQIRIGQLLKQTQMGHNATLWSLMENLSFVLAQRHVTPVKGVTQITNGVTKVQTLQFQHQILTVILVCDGFAALEHIEAALRNRKIKVHQVSAATEKDQVVAKLELSL
ncbi:MAG: hypothetical protein CK424_08025 [Legionella sp.]|nr:MAG: hypothetical protein CK424_08025 [Legionella sp.]